MEKFLVVICGFLLVWLYHTKWSYAKPALIQCSKNKECPKNYTCGKKLHCEINNTDSDKALQRRRRYNEGDDYVEYYSNEGGLYSSEDYNYDTIAHYEDIESHRNKRYTDMEVKNDHDHRDQFNDWLKMVQDGHLTKDSPHPFQLDMYRIKMSKHPPLTGKSKKGNKRLNTIESVKARLKQLEASKKMLMRRLVKLQSMKEEEEKVFVKLRANLKMVTNKHDNDEIKEETVVFKPLVDLEEEEASSR